MKRLLYLTALSVAAVLVLASAALAQSDSPGPQGVTQPCPIQLDQFPEGTVCGEGGGYIVPEEQTDGTITCEDLVDQGQAQEAYNRGVNGDLAYDPDVLDEDGDGIACENLPTAFDPSGTYTCENFLDQARAQDYFDEFIRNDPAADPGILDDDGDEIACEDLPADTASNEPAPETTSEGTASEETTTSGTTGEGTGEEKTRRERRERTKGEGTGGSVGETTAQDGGTTGSNGGAGGNGGSDGSVNDSGSGASQGGLALAVSDGLGNISRGRLPSTGGGWAVLLIAGAVLIGGGWLLVRRFSSSA